ncbi:hypothetical protein FB451DRAFT_1198177 [Mycena latifolia]|nr:hypothetical protein FB451DRAFT_1198177 [Mycena latifolia]
MSAQYTVLRSLVARSAFPLVNIIPWSTPVHGYTAEWESVDNVPRTVPIGTAQPPHLVLKVDHRGLGSHSRKQYKNYSISTLHRDELGRRACGYGWIPRRRGLGSESRARLHQLWSGVARAVGPWRVPTGRGFARQQEGVGVGPRVEDRASALLNLRCATAMRVDANARWGVENSAACARGVGRNVGQQVGWNEAAVVLLEAHEQRSAVGDEGEDGAAVVHGRAFLFPRRSSTGEASATLSAPDNTAKTMDFHSYQFTFSVQPEGTTGYIFSSSATSSVGSFGAFALASPLGASGAHAQAQARYRANNQAAEREKARRRMQALRQARREDVAEQARRDEDAHKAAESFRCSELFLRYKRHLAYHCGELHGSLDDPEYLAGWERLRFRAHPFDRADARFCLRYGRPGQREEPTAADIDACLADLQAGRMGLLLKYDPSDVEVQAALARIDAAGVAPLDDTDVEFLMRHSVPPPTLDVLLPALAENALVEEEGANSLLSGLETESGGARGRATYGFIFVKEDGPELAEAGLVEAGEKGVEPGRQELGALSLEAELAWQCGGRFGIADKVKSRYIYQIMYSFEKAWAETGRQGPARFCGGLRRAYQFNVHSGRGTQGAGGEDGEGALALVRALESLEVRVVCVVRQPEAPFGAAGVADVDEGVQGRLEEGRRPVALPTGAVVKVAFSIDYEVAQQERVVDGHAPVRDWFVERRIRRGHEGASEMRCDLCGVRTRRQGERNTVEGDMIRPAGEVGEKSRTSHTLAPVPGARAGGRDMPARGRDSRGPRVTRATDEERGVQEGGDAAVVARPAGGTIREHVAAGKAADTC